MKRSYPSDLGDKQWRLIQPYIEEYYRRGGNPGYSRRQIINAILYVTRGGISWRMLPKDFPPWQTVYSCFRRWQHSGLWLKIHDALRERVRVSVGKDPQPTVGIIDSQSARTTEKGGLGGMTAARK